VLSPAAARALAGEVLGVPAAEMPPAADRAFVAVGHVPLAVALLAAAVRGRQKWDAEPGAGRQGREFVGGGSRCSRRPDTAIPVAAEVLQRGGDGRVSFHDLAHEYLLLDTDALPALHAQLLDAYRALLDEPDQWWTLPLDEPYVWAHLAGHLAGAGDRDALAATAADPAYLAKRIARNGPHAGEADLALAAGVVTDDPVVAWWRAWLTRHAHLLDGRAGPNAQPARVAATMLAWLKADPSRPAEVRLSRLAPLLPQLYLAVRDGLRAESNALVRVLTGHTGWVRTLAWSPDSTRLATGSDDSTARVWDATTGQTLTQLTGHTPTITSSDDGSGIVTAVAWSPDGTRLGTGRVGCVQIGDIGGRSLARLTGQFGTVPAVAWSTDGSWIATVVGQPGGPVILELRDPAGLGH
jgi:WD40 domain-containing protein